ncbi:flagellar filament capping protein FliD [Paenibacillus endoradicis]|uniref:flagellar filament capping protein FliD n=1 Tax=Paenibacillus endoradicis TaxID=2972487 RepID=UPI002159A3F8|nr:flagellar filament capping protein FliD [Paenibacillus endoradicis]MCR8660507.1 flagellar filament capping protein FliD [Paenibacillus endoradicis]
MGISITGLSSNLDTAQMVKDLMAIEKIPYTNLTTKKTNLQSEQTIFRTINTKLNALETAANALRYSGDFNVYKASSSDATILKATASTNAATGSYNINVDKLATSASASIKGISGAGSDWATSLTGLSIGGKTIDLSAAFDGVTLTNNKEALTALTNYINKNSGTLNVKAELVKTDDSDNYAFSITSTTTGKQTSFDMNVSGVTIDTANKKVSLGQNAEFTMNGVSVTRSSNTFDDLISGVSVTLTKKGESTLDVKQDTASITSKIDAFVTAYNDLLVLVKDNLAKPTTEGKMNPLQGDTLLKSISSQMYNMFTATVNSNSSLKSMADIGLTIDKGITTASGMTGKITFDKEKFATALESNSSEVSKLFSNGDEANKGIALNIANTIRSNYTSTVTGILNVKITGYDSEIKMVDDRLSAMDTKLEMREARIKLQFSNMETMLSSLKNEQNWLTSQFEALTKSK